MIHFDTPIDSLLCHFLDPPFEWKDQIWFVTFFDLLWSFHDDFVHCFDHWFSRAYLCPGNIFAHAWSFTKLQLLRLRVLSLSCELLLCGSNLSCDTRVNKCEVSKEHFFFVVIPFFWKFETGFMIQSNTSRFCRLSRFYNYYELIEHFVVSCKTL